MSDISVLCIDDEEDILFALSAIMESQEWKAYSAKNVKEGIETYKKYKPDIILMDYHMPGLNGIEGVELLRKIDSEVPIIVFTIDSDQDVADDFIEAGATDFATKPIKAPDLISRIKLHIQLMDKKETKKNKLIESIDLQKGIGETTLSLMFEKLKNQNDYLTVEEISELTELSYQTTYRYLQFLENENIIDVEMSRGKIGRPKQSYKLK